MCRQANRNNILIFAEFLKLSRQMALVAIENNHPIDTFPSAICMLVEVANPVHSRLIIGPAIWRGLNHPGRREIAFGIPGCEVVDALHNQERRQYKTIAADTLDRRGPFAITRLKLLASTTPIGTRDNHSAADNAHHKARLSGVGITLELDSEILGSGHG